MVFVPGVSPVENLFCTLIAKYGTANAKNIKRETLRELVFLSRWSIFFARYEIVLFLDVENLFIVGR